MWPHTRIRWMLAVLLLIAALQCAACARSGAGSAALQTNASADPPALVEKTGDGGISRVILSAEAARRLGIQTAAIQNTQLRGQVREVVPYSAVLYDLQGVTWVYEEPENLTFVRGRVDIDFIDGDEAALASGPPIGTTIVTVGAPELYGAEFGVGS